ncbi:MAG: preprotein translocase subunit SecG [Chrysiogenetes bacterium]|nr:preprotein translocase subunit SecG [Chrysiogenetes bacterium]
METLITVLHVIVAAFLILVVLLQTGQSDMGTSFGGSSGSVLGAAGANKFMTRLTTIAAAVFMFTSISLTILGGAEAGSSSVVGDLPDTPPAATQPATTEDQAAAEEAAPAEAATNAAAEGEAAPAEAAAEGESAPEAAAQEPPADEAPAEAETPAQ